MCRRTVSVLCEATAVNGSDVVLCRPAIEASVDWALALVLPSVRRAFDELGQMLPEALRNGGDFPSIVIE